MNERKIDRKLISLVLALCEDKKWECIVHAADFGRTKQVLLHRNVEILDEYLFIKAFRVMADKKQLEYLSNITQVRYISSLTTATALMQSAKQILGVEGCSLCGRGQTIAFIDTGISRHLDFCLGSDRLVCFQDFVNENKKPYDDNGHGTFVTGCGCGSGACSGGKYCGIAPKCNIVSLKALDKNGEASADKILKAMEWIYDNFERYGIGVVCMSFGSEPLGINDPIMSGAEALWREGVTVVAAAGNSGPEYQTIKSPGVSPKIITVGGFNDNRIEDGKFSEQFFEIAEFSSRGPAFRRFKPDIVAPAVDIVSCGLKKSYTRLSGTSVATPMVAGLCALLLEKQPSLSPNDIKRILMQSARPICFNRNLEGVGYPSLKRILQD